MKICLIGPSCAGKTTLASKIKSITNVATLDLDRVFVDASAESILGKNVYRPKEVGEKMVADFMKKNKNWVIEGVFPVWKVFEEADFIIFMKPPVVVALFRQWVRFFTDQYQRRTYGFRSNLMFLTPDILIQYISSRGVKDLHEPDTFSVKKYREIIKNFKKKTIEVSVMNYESEQEICDKVTEIDERKESMR